MSKKSKGSNGNMLLLAGLGVGAALLFAGKSNAQAASSGADLPSGNANTDIPDAPKILAVNSTSSESPTPTGIVSDEEGMETVTSQSGGNGGEDDGSNGDSTIKAIANTGVKLMEQLTDDSDIPPLVSTKLTPKETAIINAGKLTASLALKRPDLYKAAYIKKYGGKTATGKRKALVAASLAIDAAVSAANAAKNGALVKAVKYPAKPQYTFVQAAGGMAAQAAVTQMAVLQKTGVKVSPAAHKVAAQVKAAKASKGKHPVKAAHPSKKRLNHKATKSKHPAGKKRR